MKAVGSTEGFAKPPTLRGESSRKSSPRWAIGIGLVVVALGGATLWDDTHVRRADEERASRESEQRPEWERESAEAVAKRAELARQTELDAEKDEIAEKYADWRSELSTSDAAGLPDLVQFRKAISLMDADGTKDYLNLLVKRTVRKPQESPPTPSEEVPDAPAPSYAPVPTFRYRPTPLPRYRPAPVATSDELAGVTIAGREVRVPAGWTDEDKSEYDHEIRVFRGPEDGSYIRFDVTAIPPGSPGAVVRSEERRFRSNGSTYRRTRVRLGDEAFLGGALWNFRLAQPGQALRRKTVAYFDLDGRRWMIALTSPEDQPRGALYTSILNQLHGW